MSDDRPGSAFRPETRALVRSAFGCASVAVSSAGYCLWPHDTAWVILVAAVGGVLVSLLIARIATPFRTLGFVPPAVTAFVGCGVWWLFVGPEVLCDVFLGFTAGAAWGAFAGYFRWCHRGLPGWDDDSQSVARTLRWIVFLPAVVAITFITAAVAASYVAPQFLVSALAERWVLMPIVFIGLLTSVIFWLRFLRPFVELCLEPFARLLYRMRVKGELNQLPAFGPCLVVANHAFWFDPCILGVILPRPITPVMTASFYKVWFLRPLLKHVFRVIVVPETAMKRDTPEVDGAIAALDRGELVVIFPEGYLRRKEEIPLRRFGQGVWRILAARPDTPVVPCWIEGGWGGKFSYKDGPPGAKAKKMDLRRKIDVGVGAAEVVPAETLASGIGTRIHLMNRVSAARGALGLEPLPSFDLPPASESAAPEEAA